MFALAWKETRPGGSQPIRMKMFRTEERRQDFIDSLTDSGIRFEITSMNTAESHTLEDFGRGMRVQIAKALHPEFIGQVGTVEKTVKKDCMVWLRLDSGKTYGAFAWNLDIA